MTPQQYSAAIKSLGYTQIGFAELVGARPRTGQYWANVAVPPQVALLVRLLQTRPELKDVISDLAA